MAALRGARSLERGRGVEVAVDGAVDVVGEEAVALFVLDGVEDVASSVECALVVVVLGGCLEACDCSSANCGTALCEDPRSALSKDDADDETSAPKALCSDGGGRVSCTRGSVGASMTIGLVSGPALRGSGWGVTRR